MFSGFKYRTAKTYVILRLEHEGRLTKAQAADMASIAGNRINSEFGIALIATGAARNKYAAAAAVFARLVVMTEEQYDLLDPFSSSNWKTATQRALQLAGASIGESYEVADALIAEQRRLNDSPAWG